MGGAKFEVYKTPRGWNIRLSSGYGVTLMKSENYYNTLEEAYSVVKKVKKASLFAKTKIGKIKREREKQ